MADYLILKRVDEPDRQKLVEMGLRAWQIFTLQKGYNADVEGATLALSDAAAQGGPGKYGIVRVDNGRTVSVTAAPSLTEDTEPEWSPVE